MTRAAKPTQFFYIAMRPTGGRTMGMRQARGTGALAESLRKESLLLLKWYRLPEWLGRESALSLKDQVDLNEALAQLVSRGAPLVEALEVAAGTIRPANRARVDRIRELVAGGTSFADACRQVGGFDDVTISVYRAAERTGDLAGAARRLSETARRRLAIGQKATTLMIYPALVMSISVIAAGGILILIVPRMHEALTGMGAKLPWFSQIVMGSGVWMRQNLTTVLIALGVLAMAAIVARSAVIRGVGALARRAPLFRDLILAQEAARFFSIMAALVRSGVPLAEALGIANPAVKHPTLAEQLERLRSRLVAGGILRTLIEEVTALPLATRRLLVAAERAGDLDSTFAVLASDLTDETDRRATRLLAALEPLLIVMMFVGIGSILLAVLLPMLTMSGQVM